MRNKKNYYEVLPQALYTAHLGPQLIFTMPLSKTQKICFLPTEKFLLAARNACSYGDLIFIKFCKTRKPVPNVE